MRCASLGPAAPAGPAGPSPPAAEAGAPLRTGRSVISRVPRTKPQMSAFPYVFGLLMRGLHTTEMLISGAFPRASRGFRASPLSRAAPGSGRGARGAQQCWFSSCSPPPLPPGRPAPRSALGCRLPPFPGPTSATPCGCAAPGLPARHPLCRQLPQRQFVSAQFTHKLPHLTPSRPPDTSRGRNPQNPPRPRDPRDSPLEPRWRDSRRPPVPSRG